MAGATHYLTGEFLAHCCNIARPEQGRVILVDGVRYLILEYDRTKDLYAAIKEPRTMQGIVLWRAWCSCGYTSALGAKGKDHARDAAFGHYVREHLLPSTTDPVRALAHKYGAEPYWHG